MRWRETGDAAEETAVTVLHSSRKPYGDDDRAG